MTDKTTGRLILASASPRRVDLMAQAGYAFEVMPSPVAEPARRHAEIPLELWPTVLAFVKAWAVQRKLRDPGATILGADTMVVLEGRIMNKPRDRRQAREMLSRLSGRRHEVITGLVVLRGEEVRLSRAVSVCRVRKLSARWLEKYLDSGLWKGKAGAYGIQDEGAKWVELISGELSNVVGLPMKLVARELAALRLAGSGSSK